MNTIHLHCENNSFQQEITLDGSKSISNRLLLINALAKSKGIINNLSTSDDTKILNRLLSQSQSTYDVGHAGTSFRFLTAFLARQTGEQILTGSDRMKQRPIHPLVNALNELGANISYIEKEGYPPLLIGEPKASWGNKITINAGISSQFISALLLIGPSLQNGLEIILEGNLVSKPYIKMTTSIMKDCGADVNWEDNSIHVNPSSYRLIDYTVEADWSAASYYYAIAVLSKSSKIRLNGLNEKSLQADHAIANISKQFGVITTYDNNSVLIEKYNDTKLQAVDLDFIDCPDIAQTVMVMVAGVGAQGLYTGLETLKIKETDRFAAMKIELEKVNVHLSTLPTRFSPKSNKTYYMSDGKVSIAIPPSFDTYKDHRMAMSLSALSVVADIKINNPEVVSKSYPNFWNDLALLKIK